MVRPKRIYKSKRGAFYYLRKGKKVYVKAPKTKKGKTMSQKQIVNIMIKNVVGDSKGRRIRPRKKRKRLKYTKQVADEQKEVIRRGLPVYLFEPQKIIPSLTQRVSSKAKKETDDYKDVLKQLSEIKKELTEKKTKGVQTQVSLTTPIPKTTQIVRTKEPVVETKEEKEEVDDVDESEEVDDVDESEEVDDDDEPLVIKKSRGQYTTFTPIERDLVKPVFNEIYKELTGKRGGGRAYVRLMKIAEGQKAGTQSDTKKIFIENLFDMFDVVAERTRGSKKPKKNYEELYQVMFNMKEKNPEQFKQTIRDTFEMITGDIAGLGNTEGDGLYNTEIEKITSKVIDETTIPVIAKNQLNDLDQYIKPNMKRFGFIINTDTIPQKDKEGGHWRCVYINNCDDYQSIEYFDPLVSTPEKSLIKKLRDISKIINPEQYFLFKNNNLQSQPDGSPNCGYHCILFLEKRFHGIPWSEATYYDEYMKQNKPQYNGEGEVMKKKKKYSSYI